MTVRRTPTYPTPLKLDSIEDIKSYLLRLHNSLSQEGHTRLRDFDATKIGNLPYLDARTYGAKCNGETDDSGAIQAAIDACPEFGKVLVPGPYTSIASSLTIDKTMTLQVQGQLKLLTNSMSGIVMGADHVDWGPVFEARVDIDRLIGTGEANGQIGVHMRNCVHSEFRIGKLRYLDCGIKFSQWNANSIIGENIFHFNVWHDCNYGVYFPSTTTVWTEGNQFYGGAIWLCDVGFKVDDGCNAGGMHIISDLNNVNALKPTSKDYVNEMTAAATIGSIIISRDIRMEECTFHGEDSWLICAPWCYRDKVFPWGTGSPVDVLESMCYGTTITNGGASGDMHYDLPAAKKDMNITFFNAAAQTITIDPNGTEKIEIITGAAGDYIQSDGAIGSYIKLLCISNGVWVPLETNGVWTEE